jgi:hypothetical protein
VGIVGLCREIAAEGEAVTSGDCEFIGTHTNEKRHCMQANTLMGELD